MTEDLGIFFADFGLSVTLNLPFEERTVDALFFHPDGEIYQLEQINSNESNMALIKTEDAADLDRNDCQITINAVKYNIQDIVSDGTGFTKLYVEKDIDAG